MEKNKLYFGDCLDVMKEISDKTIDMVLCDLPYGSSACEWDIIIPFDELWSQYERIIKDSGVIVLFGVGMFAHKLAVSNEKLFKYEMVWDKEFIPVN
jgi:site-specific DNA-methyltransferase (adenine-specific)